MYALFAGKTAAFNMLKDALRAALARFNDVLAQHEVQPLVLLGDSKTMEDLLQKLSVSFGHERFFLHDEGIRKFQELGQYKSGTMIYCCLVFVMLWVVE